MRKTFLLLIILLFLANSINAQILNEILKRMDSHQTALMSLKADVEIKENRSYPDLNGIINMEMCLSTNPTIRFTDASYGKLNYMPNRYRGYYLRIDTIEPIKESFLIKNRQYAKYQPIQNQIIMGKSVNTDVNNFFTLLGMSKKELLAKYSFQLLRNKKINNEEAWHIKIRPRTYKSYKYAEIWVDKHGMTRQIKHIETNDDWKSILLSDLKKNPKNLDATIFNLKVPKGTKILYR